MATVRGSWFDTNSPGVIGNRYNPNSPVLQPQPMPIDGGNRGIDFGGITMGGGGGYMPSPPITMMPVSPGGNPFQSPTTPSAPAPSGGGDSSNPLFQGIRPDLVQYFISHGITPTGRGTGPTDIAYLNDQMSAPGQDPGYWLNEKLPNQVFGGQGGGGGSTGGGGGGMPGTMPVGSGATQYGNFGVAPAPYTPQPFTGNIFQPQAFQGTPYQPPGFQGTTFQPGQFNAPTGLNYTNDPGYLERMRLGQQAIENSAAARGSLLSGGTLKALERYGQDYGSNEFQNVYGRALGTAGFNQQAGQLGFQNQMQTAGFNQQAGQMGFGNTLAALGQQNTAGQQGFQNMYGNYLNQQAANFQANQANIQNQRQAQQDYWGNLNQLYAAGNNAAVNSYQPVSSA